ncbi:uncharacterized protein LOC127163500 [Labeo rohita]|uniref:uncharacterized protein LOC127163500 n=1 Tax=Labeo rohita TaxID=84645 RepID=UPI0021E2061B|nr:uncharacterized protein LOC127163500 [Labeo rohita]
MKISVLLLYFFVTLCPLSEGLPLNCPPPYLNEAAHLRSGKLCATLQLQTKPPCPGVSLSVSENVRLNPEKWHLESLSLKVEKACSFIVLKQDKESQHFPGGFYANITINSINAQSEFLCVCTKLHIRNRRAPTFQDFAMKHLLDNPADPSDTSYWKKAWDSATKYRVEVKNNNNIPRVQSFMPREEFNKKFTRDFKIKASNSRTLYRSENRMNIYDVTNKNGKIDVVKRYDYVVVDLDNNDRPIHYEPVSDESAEGLGKIKPGQSGASRLFKGWRGGVQQFEEAVEPVAEGENIAMTVIGAAPVTHAATIFAQILHVMTFFLI